jgi:hypothetical protein
MHLNGIAFRIENLSIQHAEVYGISRSADWALLKLAEEVSELAQAHLTATGKSRDRDLSAEEQQRVVADKLGDVLGVRLVYAKQRHFRALRLASTEAFLGAGLRITTS